MMSLLRRLLFCLLFGGIVQIQATSDLPLALRELKKREEIPQIKETELTEATEIFAMLTLNVEKRNLLKAKKDLEELNKAIKGENPVLSASEIFHSNKEESQDILACARTFLQMKYVPSIFGVCCRENEKVPFAVFPVQYDGGLKLLLVKKEDLESFLNGKVLKQSGLQKQDLVSGTYGDDGVVQTWKKGGKVATTTSCKLMLKNQFQVGFGRWFLFYDKKYQAIVPAMGSTVFLRNFKFAFRLSERVEAIESEEKAWSDIIYVVSLMKGHLALKGVKMRLNKQLTFYRRILTVASFSAVIYYIYTCYNKKVKTVQQKVHKLS